MPPVEPAANKKDPPSPFPIPYPYIGAIGVAALLLLLLPLLLLVFLLRRCRRPPPGEFNTDGYPNNLYDDRDKPVPVFVEEVDEVLRFSDLYFKTLTDIYIIIIIIIIIIQVYFRQKSIENKIT